MNTNPSRTGGVAPSERPFFFFLTAVLAGVYGWSVINLGMVHEPAKLALFTGLMLIHLGLHWTLLLMARQPAWWDTTYLLVQGLLAFTLVYLGRNIGVLFGLYMALIGECIGLLRPKPVRLAVFLCYFILLSLASYYVTMGPNNLLSWAVFTVPSGLFVIIYVVLYSRQAEARERAQALAAELEAANQRLSEYAARVEDLTIANERQRMARELHDTLSQGLAGLILQLEAADAHLAHERPARAREIVRDAMERARTALSDARRAIGNLRTQPGALPFDEAVRFELERFTEATGIPCETQALLKDPVPETLAEPSLRIIAEALTNIGRHAQAKHAGLKLSAGPEELCAEIWDDGTGFDVSNTQAGHYGLLGMRERARLAGGRLEVLSAVGQGTRVILHMPLTGR